MLAAALAGFDAAIFVGMAAVGLYLILQAPHFSPFVWAHLSVGAALSIATLVLVPQPGAALAEGLSRGIFIAVLFASLGTLRIAAQLSPRVREVGRMLVRQPPGRRYFAIVGGSTLLGAILNFGVLALFVAMIRDANAGADANPAAAARERRMMLGLLRGFSLVMFWCPLTVAFAVTTSTIAGAQWPLMAGLGLVIGSAVVAAGWIAERGAQPKRPPGGETAAFSWSSLAPLAILLVILSTLAALVEEFTRGQLIHGVILFVPIIGVLWLASAGGLRGIAPLGDYIVQQVPLQRQELAVLSNAAFVGTLIGVLLPQALIEAVLGPQGVPAVFVPALFLLLVVVFGQIGANPLISVSVLATAMSDPAAYGVNPTLAASALAVGWGLAIGSSPATAATMYIGRMTGFGSMTVGSRWNGPYTALALVVGCLILTLLSWLQ